MTQSRTFLSRFAVMSLLLILVLGLLPMVVQAQTDGVDMSFTGVPGTAAVGDTFTATIQITSPGTQQIDLAEVHLTWDPAILQANDATPLATAQLPFELVSLNIGTGLLDYSGSTVSNFPTVSNGAPLNFLSIDFEVIGTGTTAIDFEQSIFPVTTATFGGDAVLNSATDAPINVPAPDTTPPVITLNGANPLELTVGDTYTEPGATANDNVDGDISGSIVIDASAVNTSVVGTYQVTYNVTDNAGNAATEVIRTVNVNAAPNTPPDLAPIADVEYAEFAEIDGTRVSFTATDPDPNETLTYSATGLPDGLSLSFNEVIGTISHTAVNGGPNNDGVFNVEITVTDLSGDFDTETFTWTVVERSVNLISPLDGATIIGNQVEVQYEVFGGDTSPTYFDHAHLYLLDETYFNTNYPNFMMGDRIGSLPLSGTFTFGLSPEAPDPVAPGTYKLILRTAKPTHAEYQDENGDFIEEIATITVQAPLPDEYTLAVTTAGDGSGNVTKSPDQTTYTDGTQVTLSANADAGSTFAGWSGDVPPGSENVNPLTITMDSNKSITATFNADVTEPLPSFCVNVNGAAGTAFGRNFLADSGSYYTNSSTFGNINDPDTATILTLSGAQLTGYEADIFKTERYGGKSNVMVIDLGASNNLTGITNDGSLPNGDYVVDLYFAEIFVGVQNSGANKGAGARVFDVTLEGNLILDDLDLFTVPEPDRPLTALVFTNSATVSDNTLTIEIDASVDNGKISAFCVSPDDVTDTTPPVINLLGDDPLELTVGDEYVEAGATATDDTDDNISLRVVPDASAVDVNTEGTYQVTYNVTDAAGNVATEVTRTVNVVLPANTVPELDPITDQLSFESDTDIQVDVSATDDDPLTYGATGLPAGLSIDPVTGVISGDITASAGVYPVTVSVNDNVNPEVTTSFTWSVALNTGGVCVNVNGSAFFASDFRYFEADNYFIGGKTFGNENGSLQIANTDDDFIYRTERYGGKDGNNPPFSYAIPVSADGTYDVRLYFAEIFASNAGARVFNVDIEGDTVLTDYDIYATASALNGGGNGKNYAVIEMFNVAVTGTADLDFYLGPNGVDNAKISAICVEPAEPANTAPVVTITSPADNSSFTEGDTVSFSGTANDTEDGDLSASLNWSSDQDDSIGTGASFDSSTLSVGTHTITAEVTDNDGTNPLTGSDTVTITIDPTPEPVVLVINEIMQNPAAVGDSAGEWFELYNPTASPIDIDGWTIQDNDSDSHVIDNGGPLEVPAMGYLVLGNNANTATNGGVTVDYEYGSGFFLANGADELVLLDTNQNEIDRVEWDGGPSFPDPTGASMALESPELDNTVGANWCESSVATYGDGDSGTPGAANDCGVVPAILTVTIDPDTFSVDDGVQTATVTRSGDIGSDLLVTLTSSNPVAVSVLPTVTILTGESSAEFDVTPFASGTATVSASAAGYVDGTATVTVLDVLAITKIHEIQGSSDTNLLDGQTVSIQGVVVGDYDDGGELEGFYVQEEMGDEDGNPATSEGIFVFCDGTCSPSPSIGNIVTVTGNVDEGFGQTQLDDDSSSLAIVIDDAGDNLNLITPASISFPQASESDLEAYEGMFVQVSTDMIVTEYFNFDRFSEIRVWNDGSGAERPFQFTQVNSPDAIGFEQAEADFRAASVLLDDGAPSQNIGKLFPQTSGTPIFGDASFTPGTPDGGFRGGDSISGIEGVMGYGFSNYRIFISDPSAVTATDGGTLDLVVNTNNPRPAVPTVGGTLKVASFNVLNFFTTLDDGNDICGPNQNLGCRGADNATEYDRQLTKIVNALTEMDADIVGLIELENNAAAAPAGDGTDPVLEALVTELNAQSSRTYGFVDAGTIGTDAIKVAFIYDVNTVNLVGSHAILDNSVDSRFLDTKNRPVLAQTFEEAGTGAVFTAAVNHLKSKGSACDDVGDPDPIPDDGTGSCNGVRTDAAEALVDWLATDPTGSGDEDFLIIGDLNSYAMEDPIMAIREGADDTSSTSDDYADLTNEIPGQYGFVFDGRWGTLDYALANLPLASQVTGVAEWHINADEPDALDYDFSFNPEEWFDGTDAFRSSDHDPVIVGLNLTPPPTGDVFFTLDPATQTVTVGDIFTVDVLVENTGQPIDLAEVHIDFEPTVLEVLSLTPQATSELPLELVTPVFDNSLGTIDYGAGTVSNFPTGDLTLLSIEFEAIAPATSTDLTFNFVFPRETIATADGGQNVLDGVNEASVVIEDLPTYTITATAGVGGSITPDGTVSVTQGDNQIFEIEADPGYVIDDVLVDGLSVGAVSQYEFTNVTADATISASFTFVGLDDVFIVFDPTQDDVAVGDIFDLTVEVQANNQPVDAVQIHVDFDPAVLQVVSVQEDTAFLPQILLGPTFDNTLGQVDYAAGVFGSVTGTFDVLTITFEAIAPSTGTDVTFFSPGFPAETEATFAGNDVLAGTTDALVTVTDVSSLNGTVDLQGRDPAPNAAWSVPLTVKLYEPGTTTLVDTFTTMTNDSGEFTVAGITPGTYDIAVKNSHTLQVIVPSVALQAGTNPVVDFGTLLEGDANDDNVISLTDFSLLSAAFGTVDGDTGFLPNADFNEDGFISIADFSLLAGNFLAEGDKPGN